MAARFSRPYLRFLFLLAPGARCEGMPCAYVQGTACVSSVLCRLLPDTGEHPRTMRPASPARDQVRLRELVTHRFGDHTCHVRSDRLAVDLPRLGICDFPVWADASLEVE